MEPKIEATQPQFRSGLCGPNHGELGFGFDDIHGLISNQPEAAGSSFTALLDLPPPQAVELLVNEDFPAKPMAPPIFPSNIALIDRASKFSVFATADNSSEKTTILSASSPMKIDSVKREPPDSDSRPNSSSPAVSTQTLKSGKRKEKEKKVKESNKKSKKVAAANDVSEESGEKLPYVHVRARRGQATDSHSLAERARREKINARMKLLQDLVPGCNKISGTAMVLDEIINHVQALQRQVEFLSMRLAAVNPRIDFNLDAILAAESGSSMDNSYMGQALFAPSVWPDVQIEGSRQHQYQQPLHFVGLHQPSWGKEEGTSNFITPENSLVSYDSPANSASLHSNQLKMEL